MPFPVIPVVVASGITALVTYVGVRMAMDEKCEYPHDDTKDLDETAREGEDARETFYKARRLLEVRREKTQGKLESLGRQKAGTFENVLIPFEETFSRIRNVDFSDTDLPPIPAEVVRGIAPESAKIREVTAHMTEVVAGGVDALAPDALAALAACGSAGVLPPASGDSAASGLSGVGVSESASGDSTASGPSGAGVSASASGDSAAAAPSGLAAGNATLAWLRGGALPPGNGGTVILGRVAAAPVLLVNGTMLSSQADEEAMEQAVSNLLDAEEAARTVGRRAIDVQKVLKRLTEGDLTGDLTALRDLVSANDDYRTYGRPEKALVGRAASLAKVARDMAETPLLGKDGGITDTARQALKKAKKVLKALDAA